MKMCFWLSICHQVSSFSAHAFPGHGRVCSLWRGRSHCGQVRELGGQSRPARARLVCYNPLASWPPNCTPFQARRIGHGPPGRDLRFQPVGQANGQTGRAPGSGSPRPMRSSIPDLALGGKKGGAESPSLLSPSFPSSPGSWQWSPGFQKTKAGGTSCPSLPSHSPEAPALIGASVRPGANCQQHTCPLFLPLAPPVTILHLQDRDGFLGTKDASDRAVKKMQHSTFQYNPKSTKRMDWNPLQLLMTCVV